MPDISVLIIFIPTFFIISISPGLCMSLAMSLGMTIGVKRTIWMMLGEVVGVSVVAVCAIYGVATLVLNYPLAFDIFKWLAGLYLFYLGVKLWFTPISLQTNNQQHTYTNIQLVIKGFATAVSNPKGWAFMTSILPPFLDTQKPIFMQLTVLLTIIICSEFICMLIYATGGKGLSNLLNNNNQAQWINRIGGGLLALVGIWLAIG